MISNEYLRITSAWVSSQCIIGLSEFWVTWIQKSNNKYKEEKENIAYVKHVILPAIKNPTPIVA